MIIAPSHTGMSVTWNSFTQFIAVKMYFLLSEYYFNHPEYGEKLKQLSCNPGPHFHKAVAILWNRHLDIAIGNNIAKIYFRSILLAFAKLNNTN